MGCLLRLTPNCRRMTRPMGDEPTADPTLDWRGSCRGRRSPTDQLDWIGCRQGCCCGGELAGATAPRRSRVRSGVVRDETKQVRGPSGIVCDESLSRVDLRQGLAATGALPSRTVTDDSRATIRTTTRPRAETSRTIPEPAPADLAGAATSRTSQLSIPRTATAGPPCCSRTFEGCELEAAANHRPRAGPGGLGCGDHQNVRG